MLKTERHAFILRQVNLHNKALVVDLYQVINVSADIMREDLQQLAEGGKVIKMRGGVLFLLFNLKF